MKVWFLQAGLVQNSVEQFSKIMNWENNERSLLSSIPLNNMSVKRMCVKL